MFVFKFGDRVLILNCLFGCVCYKNMFIVFDSKNYCLKVYDGLGRFLYMIGEEGGVDG